MTTSTGTSKLKKGTQTLKFNQWETTNGVDFVRSSRRATKRAPSPHHLSHQPLLLPRHFRVFQPTQTDPATRPFRRLLPLEPVNHTKSPTKSTKPGIGVYESEMHASLEAPIRLIREMRALKREKKKSPKKLQPLATGADPATKSAAGAKA